MRATHIFVVSTLVALAAFLALPSAPAHAAATITVDTTADGDAPDNFLTLEEAIKVATGALPVGSLTANEADNVSGTPGAAEADTIVFDTAVFPSGTPATIILGNGLPALSTGNDTITGVGAGVIVNGGALGFESCFLITSNGNAIKGMEIQRCPDIGSGAAIQITGSDNNTVGGAGTGEGNVIHNNNFGVWIESGSTDNDVIGNKIGTLSDGVGASGNSSGILIDDSSKNTIGGSGTGEGNVISANADDGLTIIGSSNGNTVMGNKIGTDITGTLDRGNGNFGVNIQGSGNPQNNVIGGNAPGEGNLISGNTRGVRIADVGTDFNQIVGNYIGTDVTGTIAIGNSWGVSIQQGPANTVVDGNVISGSTAGVEVFGDPAEPANSQSIVRNKIGTTADGNAPLPNLIGVSTGSFSSHNTIGGAPGDANLIAFNTAEGVLIQGSNTVHNTVAGNSIHSNGAKGIDTAAGGNLELPPPSITSAAGGSVSGIGCSGCTVEVFADLADEGRMFLGSTVADGSGLFSLGGLTIPLSNVTATATDASGNTSEFSAPFAVPPDGDNDGVRDSSDPCPALAEDHDGFEDADGCPDTDNDLDGICDAHFAGAPPDGATCGGIDSGEMCFDPAGTLSCPTTDCSNVAEDFDGFHDDDGCPGPDNDNDGFPDGTDDCPGTDAHAGPDGMLGSPEDLDHNGVQNGAESSLTTDDSVLVFEDYDGVLDGDGCHDSPGDDFDGDGLIDDDEVFVWGTEPFNPDTDADGVLDGADNCPALANPGQTLPPWAVPVGDADCDAWTTADENAIGTAPDDACGASAWPPDFNDDQSVDIFDINFLRVPVFFSEAPGPPYDVRLDLNPDGIIDIFDVNRMRAPIFFASCTP